MSKKQNRIYLELTAEAMERIDRLVEKRKLSSRSNLLRLAVAILDCADEKMDEGFRLGFRKGEEFKEIIIPFLE